MYNQQFEFLEEHKRHRIFIYFDYFIYKKLSWIKKKLLLRIIKIKMIKNRKIISKDNLLIN